MGIASVPTLTDYVDGHLYFEGRVRVIADPHGTEYCPRACDIDVYWHHQGDSQIPSQSRPEIGDCHIDFFDRARIGSIDCRTGGATYM